MKWSLSWKYKRRDADFDRLKAVEEAESKARYKYFTSQYSDLWYMQLLVTHRSFRRQGAGSAIVEWGAARADAEGVHCGTESSPMGRPIYESFGFSEIGRMVIQVAGHRTGLDFPVMLREPKADSNEKHSFQMV